MLQESVGVLDGTISAKISGELASRVGKFIVSFLSMQ